MKNKDIKKKKIKIINTVYVDCWYPSLLSE